MQGSARAPTRPFLPSRRAAATDSKEYITVYSIHTVYILPTCCLSTTKFGCNTGDVHVFRAGICRQSLEVRALVLKFTLQVQGFHPSGYHLAQVHVGVFATAPVMLPPAAAFVCWYGGPSSDAMCSQLQYHHDVVDWLDGNIEDCRLVARIAAQVLPVDLTRVGSVKIGTKPPLRSGLVSQIPHGSVMFGDGEYNKASQSQAESHGPEGTPSFFPWEIGLLPDSEAADRTSAQGKQKPFLVSLNSAQVLAIIVFQLRNRTRIAASAETTAPVIARAGG